MAKYYNDQAKGALQFPCKWNVSMELSYLYFGWYKMPPFLQSCFSGPRQTDCPLNVSKALFFFLVMPNAIFVWKDYTRSFPAEKTGLWKMVSENEINHAKVVQGVFEMNIWIWTAKLPPSSSSSFSQLFERVLRAGKQVNGPNCTFLFPPPLLIRFAPMRGISLTRVFNKWAQIQEKIISIPVDSLQQYQRKINSGF